VSYKSTVVLDGSQSSDDDGPDRVYRWETTSVPAGSIATLDDATLLQPSFFTDVPGQYRFTLIVGDTFKTSEASSVTITAVNDAPVAVVSPGRKMYAGTQFTLDGSASSDANDDPLTYQWTVTSAPAGSTASPASPASATTAFVPDVHGQYELALTVHDGSSSSAPATVALDVYFPLTNIPFFIRDAEYSPSLDRVVIVGIFPNALYLYDPASGNSTSVALSQEPFELSLSPDGLSAVVGHSYLVSVVDLQTRTVTLTKATGAGTLDIVHGGNGYAYVFPTAGTSNSIQNVPLSGSAVTAGGLAPITYAMRVPGTLTMYAAPTAYDGIYRYDIVSNSATLTRAVTSPSCEKLWISDDKRIITRCGTIFSTSNVEAQDMQLLGSLPGVSYIADLAQSSTSSTLLVVPGDITKLRIHNSGSLALVRELTLPRFLIDDMGYTGNGAYVFLRADNQSYTVIEETSTSAATVFGMGTFSLSEP
jgi:hypothetical protein